MKKTLLTLPVLLTLSSCSLIDHYNKPQEELHTDVRTPHIKDINFNKEGSLPQDIKNQRYYDVNFSGSAVENCEVRDYGDARVRSRGKNKILIGDAHDWDIVRIDCGKNKGNGKTDENHDLEIKVYTPEKVYHGKTEIKHE